MRGIRQSDLKSLQSVSDHILAGSLDNFKGDDAIAIGVGLARRFALNVGSDLTLISPQGAATAFGTVPRVRAYKVVAIFQVGENEYDSGYVFLPLEAAQVYFQKPDVATQLEVMVSDPERVTAVHRAIFDALRGTQVQIIDWTQSNNSFFAAVQVEQNVMFLILTLIILVAAFNVISSLIMMVKDKTRDIAVLRTLGAGRGRCDAHLPDVRCVRSALPARWSAWCSACCSAGTSRPSSTGWRRSPAPRVFNPEVYMPDAPAGTARLARGGAGGCDGAGAVAAGDAVSELARRADRSGRGAAA